MQNFIIAKCSLCDYEFEIEWNIIVAKYKKGVEVDDRLGDKPCPQCRAEGRLSVAEDIAGRRFKRSKPIEIEMPPCY